ncbi:hypothetical protein ACOSP7_020620 [Xanthoceras sorbifolium]
MGLIEQLISINRGTQPVANYLATIRSLADQLAMIGEPVPKRNLVLHTLNGLDSEFKELSAVVRDQDTVINFDELYDKLIEYESYLKREEGRTSISLTANAARYFQPKSGNQFQKKGNQHNSNNPNQRHNSQRGGQGSNQYSQSYGNNFGKNNPYANVICQFCDKKGHVARFCYTAKWMF